MAPAAERIAASPKLPDPRRRRIVIALDAIVRPFSRLLALASGRRSTDSADPRRILLIRMDGIGDLMMSTAVFPALRRRFPRARIDLLCSTLVLPVAKHLVDLGYIDRLFSMPLAGASPAMWRRLIAGLRAGHYDVAADLRGDFRNVILAWIASVPRRIGFPYSGFDFLLTDVLPWEIAHQSVEVSRVGELISGQSIDPQPRLPLPVSLTTWSTAWLGKQRSATDDRPWVALHLSAGQPAKLWPVAHFVRLAKLLQEVHKARLIVIGAPDDRGLADELNSQLNEPALVAAGRASLLQTAALLAQCNLMIGSDSGPAHIASAVGCPVVVLFGTADERVMRPFTPRLRLLRAAHRCDPRCDGKTCAIPDRRCVASISPERVFAAAGELLQRSPDAG